MTQQVDERVYDPRTEPAVTLDGPEVQHAAVNTSQASYLGTAVFNKANPAELTEVEYLRLLHEETEQKVAGLTTAVQRLAQELHDIRQQGIVRTN
jgi:hypothetical protein